MQDFLAFFQAFQGPAWLCDAQGQVLKVTPALLAFLQLDFEDFSRQLEYQPWRLDMHHPGQTTSASSFPTAGSYGQIFRFFQGKQEAVLLEGLVFNLCLPAVGEAWACFVSLPAAMDRKDARDVSQDDFERARVLARLGRWNWHLGEGVGSWSEEGFLLLGREPQERVTLAQLKAMIHPEDFPTFREEFRDAVAKGRNFTFEVRLQHADGTFRNFRSRCDFLRDAAGNVREVMGIAQDVTEQKASQQALLESETLYREIVNHMTNGVAVYRRQPEGPNFVFVDINSAGAAMGRYTREQHFGATLTDLYPGIVSFGLLNVLEDVWQTGKPQHVPVRHYQDDQVRLWVENYVCKLPSGELLVVYEDRTEPHLMLTRLQQSEGLFRTLFDGSTDVVYLFDESGTLRLCNRQAVEVLGLPAERGPDLNRLRFVRCVEGGSTPSNLASMVVGDQRLFEADYLCSSGRSISVEEAISCLDVDGRRQFLCIARDLAKRKEKEAARLADERAVHSRQRLESLGVLAGGIAHDFNNILMAISGNAEMALEHVTDPSVVSSCLPQILEATKRATLLTGQMMAYAGKGRVSQETLNVNQIVNELMPLLRSSVDKKIRFDLRLDPHLGTITGDPGQIQQVVMNLLFNAAESYETSRSSFLVQVVSRMTNLSPEALASWPVAGSEGVPIPERPGAYVQLDVSDQGCGMSEEVQRRLFEPFFTTKFTGRGLGMAAVLGILKAHQAGMCLRSKLGQGTVFSLFFPATACSVMAQQPTILIADDEPPLLSLMSAVITRLGYQPKLAENGKQALAVLQERLPLVAMVLDRKMPECDGFEVISEALRLGYDVPVLMVSGDLEWDQSSLKSLPRRFAFLQKPFPLQNFTETLSELLGKGRESL
jgi:PAS domain S-box-containing protein